MKIDLKERLDRLSTLGIAELPRDEDLHAICRKVDVGKRLRSSYLEGWRVDSSSDEISMQEYMGVVELLLSVAERLDKGREPGVVLKLANSTAKVLDITERQGIDRDDTARYWNRVDTLLAKG